MDTTTTTDVRRNNLRLLIREAGGIDRIAKKLKIGKTELGHIASLNNECRIGSWLARDMEHRLGLEIGWLDMSHEYLPSAARQIARKWLILPPGLQDQIRDYIDLQIHSLRFELKSTHDDKTDFSKIYDRQST
ncbi:MAG: hypothetical protein O7D86_04370 [Proteobacteria bacterium]|nr:hypothetical protein [Pseudomonadota bacterium]